MQSVTAQDLKDQLASYLHRAESGERILVTCDGMKVFSPKRSTSSCVKYLKPTGGHFSWSLILSRCWSKCLVCV